MAINNLLLVDDESDCGQAAKRYFQDNLTPNVDLAGDYESALEKIRQTRYDLIVLDSLEGACFRICEDIREIPHGDVIIFSGNLQILEEAERRGIPFYDKQIKFLNKIVAKYK